MDSSDMYAVIFKASFKDVNQLDAEYHGLAKQLQVLAKEQYHCQNFVSTTEGNQEIAISYWSSLEHLKAWKNDPLHQIAQSKGMQQWYETYTVEIVEIVKSYSL